MSFGRFFPYLAWAFKSYLMHARQQDLIIAFVPICAFGLGLILVEFFYQDSGDLGVYLNLAENFLRGCALSHSSISTSQCEPAIGGYFPGYPAFIGLIWLLFDKSIKIILVGQLFVHSAAIFWLLRGASRITTNPSCLIVIGLSAVLSPLQLGWFRFVLTEPIVLTTSLWLIAELLHSYADRKVRWFGISLALVCAVFIRPDSVLVLGGLALIIVSLFGAPLGIRAMILVLCLFSMPVSAWMARNFYYSGVFLKVGTDYVPHAPGYFGWVNTWVVTEHERADALFQFTGRRIYSDVKLTGSGFISEIEIEEGNNLVWQAHFADGQAFPTHLDQQFASLAGMRNLAQPLVVKIEIIISRCFSLVLNPRSSWGLPAEFDDVGRRLIQSSIQGRDLIAFVAAFENNVLVSVVKLCGFLYRVLLFSGLGICSAYVACRFLFGVYRRAPFGGSGRSEFGSVILMGALVILLSRLLFFSSLGYLESRYLIQAIPFVEVGLAFFLFEFLNTRGRDAFL